MSPFVDICVQETIIAKNFRTTNIHDFSRISPNIWPYEIRTLLL